MMASVPPSQQQPDGGSPDLPPQELTVNLQIVSPSVGVTRPLQFESLPSMTTVKQLKEKIRETLPFRPGDDKQRLIHRGRALMNDAETLLDIFGADALRVPEKQTIHLVIRELSDNPPAAPPVPNRASTQAPAASTGPGGLPQPQQPHQHGAIPPHQYARRAQFVPAAGPGQAPPQPQPQMPFPFPGAVPPQHMAALQQHNQQMAQWLSNVHRDAMTRVLVNQNQRGRAHAGMRGIGDPAANNAQPPTTASGRNSPAPGQPSQNYPTHMSLRDVQNALQGADANQATQAMTNAMQRSASSASLPSLQNRVLHQPGVTTPIFPGGAGSRAGSRSRRATPEPGHAAIPTNAQVPTSAPSAPSQGQTGYEVYLLSSPEGPRALLLNHGTSETFYTPRLRTQASLPQVRGFSPMNMVYETQPDAHYQAQTGPQYQHQQQAQWAPQAPQPQEQGQDGAAAQALQPNQQQQQPQQQGIGLAHPNNPLPPLLVQLWPHIWLFIKLSIFVWILNGPDTPWSRWFLVVGMALCLFIYGSGLLDGMLDQVWQPVGRQIENLLPRLRENEMRLVGNEARDQQGEGTEANGSDPDPAQMAARLIAQRRAREGWLATQYRRIERAGVLFLASIAPGLAERHIANQEAEARAERERIEAEERAERERREAEQAAETAAAEAAAMLSGADGPEAAAQATDVAVAEEAADADRGDVPAAHQEPLVQI